MNESRITFELVLKTAVLIVLILLTVIITITTCKSIQLIQSIPSFPNDYTAGKFDTIASVFKDVFNANLAVIKSIITGIIAAVFAIQLPTIIQAIKK